jgi:hypothetical protein
VSVSEERRGLGEARALRAWIMAARRSWADVPAPEGVEQIGTRGPGLGIGHDGEVHWFTDRHSPLPETPLTGSPPPMAVNRRPWMSRSWRRAFAACGSGWLTISTASMAPRAERHYLGCCFRPGGTSWVSQRESSVRRRFSVPHEVGHFLLHVRSESVGVFCRATTSSRVPRAPSVCASGRQTRSPRTSSCPSRWCARQSQAPAPTPTRWPWPLCFGVGSGDGLSAGQSRLSGGAARGAGSQVAAVEALNV